MALEADYVTVTSLFCMQNIVFYFWPTLTYPAARSLCDS